MLKHEFDSVLESMNASMRKHNLKEYVPCESCINDYKNLITVGVRKVGNLTQTCDCYKSHRVYLHFTAKCREYNLPKGYLRSTIQLDKDSTEYLLMTQYWDLWDETFRNTAVYLYGKENTQKTSIATQIAKYGIDKNKVVLYYTFSDAIDMLMDYDNNAKKKEELTKADLIILDDCFDKLTNNQTVKNEMYNHFFRGRVSSKGNKAIIYITRFAMEDIPECWSDFSDSFFHDNMVIAQATQGYKHEEVSVF